MYATLSQLKTKLKPLRLATGDQVLSKGLPIDTVYLDLHKMYTYVLS